MSIADCIAILGRSEESAMDKKIGLTADRVRQLMAANRELNPQEVRRATAKAFLANFRKRGRRIPASVVDALHADYLALRSNKSTAQAYGINENTLRVLLWRRGKPKLRKRHLVIEYKGIRYHLAKDGTYRSHTALPRSLHQRIWIDANGPIPDAHCVVFRNDTKQCSLENLELVGRLEQQKRAGLNRHKGAKKITPPPSVLRSAGGKRIPPRGFRVRN